VLHVQFWENAVKVCTLYVTFLQVLAYLCNIYTVTFGSTRRLQISTWATVCKTVRPMLSVRCLICLSVLSVCKVRALWQNGWTDQDETWHVKPRPWPHCVRWRPSSPSPKGHSPHTIFGPYLLRTNGCIDQDVT